MSKLIQTNYKLNTGLGTIALCTDLHECKAIEATELLRKIKPNMILIAGDTFEPKHQKHIWNDDRRMIRFLQEAVALAPVYMSLGNHERYITKEDIEQIRKLGVQLLDNSYVTLVDKKGQAIYLGGLSSEAFRGTIDFEFLDEFEKQKGRKLLLCHHPEYYERYLKERKIDYIFSGHAHGGQLRFMGHGIYAPGQGLFPKYHHGVYDGRLIVSSGCANNTIFPRWGNPKEVVICEDSCDAKSKTIS